jgi:hypothetical protein
MYTKVFYCIKQDLERLYLDSELTLNEIGDVYSCSAGTIRKFMVRYNIPMRKAAHLEQTERAKKKISEKSKNRKASPETREKHRQALLGKTREKSRNWKGGIVYIDGYRYIRKPEHPNARNSYINESALVMEKHIGRFLKKGEVVHHMNRIRDDNRIENLKLFSSQGEHLRYHNLYDKLK